jgi:DNA-binding CsgD family transcriptional regulator
MIIRELGDGKQFVRLSPAECRILILIVAGYRYKEIAGRLGNAESTIKSYAQHLLNGLGLNDRGQLAGWCLQHTAALLPTRAWVDPEMHPVGCSCPGEYCSMISRGGEMSEIAA